MTLPARWFTGRDLKARLLWMIGLRYVAAAGIAAGLVGARALGVALPAAPVAAIAVAVLAYNAALHVVVHRVRFRRWPAAGRALALTQTTLDLLSLGVLVHLTGGVVNPLTFFVVFHGLLVAIVLSARAAYAVSALTVVGFATLALLEQTGALPVPAALLRLPPDPRLAFGLVLGVAATVNVAIYLASTLIGDIAARDARLHEANRRLQDHDRLREQTVRRVAHDLKGPLGVVQTSTRVLLEGYAGDLNERQRDALGRIEARSLQLHRLITQLFAITDARAIAAREPDDVALAEVVAEAVDGARERLEQKGLRLELSVPSGLPTLCANRDQLRALVSALLDNAIGYTPTGGLVRLEARLDHADVALEVADTGVGIPTADLAQAGELLFRGVEARKLVRDGNGLGLALVRATAAAYDGTLRLESPWTEAPGGPRGTRAVVTLSPPRPAHDPDGDE